MLISLSPGVEICPDARSAELYPVDITFDGAVRSWRSQPSSLTQSCSLFELRHDCVPDLFSVGSPAKFEHLAPQNLFVLAKTLKMPSCFYKFLIAHPML
jgi:hypothetical protein